MLGSYGIPRGVTAIFCPRGRDDGSSRTEITSQQQYSDFQPQRDVSNFFRCGQVFSIQITSELQVIDGDQTLVDVAQLPEPITALNGKAKAVRLAQILELPLAKMVQYSEENNSDQNMVWCRLCRGVAPAADSKHWMSKDFWASTHFRWSHWKYYQLMIQDREKLSRKLAGSGSKDLHVPPCDVPRESIENTFSKESWLQLEGITSSEAIDSDEKVENLLSGTSEKGWWECPGGGPTMIRRFVVIREGLESCQCLGIHT